MRTLDPVKHEVKRQEILAAAECCISRDGFRGASIADICKEAGISPGHLYHYFPSKEAIITAITEAGLENVEARFAQMTQGSNAVAVLVSQLDRVKGKRGNARMKARNLLLLDMLAEAGRNPAIAKIVRRNTARLRLLLVEFLRSAQARGQIDQSLDAEVTAGVLLSVTDGMRTLGIRDADLDIEKSIGHLQILMARFLSPPAVR